MNAGAPRLSFWLILAVILVAACSRDDHVAYAPAYEERSATSVPEYVFGVHPLHNPERLFAIYGPVVDYLGERIPGTRFRLEASRNYAEFEKKLYARRFQFALPNPYQTIEAMAHGYRVFGKMGDDDNFRGIILVRRDSGIERLEDLKGKAVSYPAPTALAATMMPQLYLHSHGLDVKSDIRNVYVGSQESSIMNVYLGLVAAGATWPVPWQAFRSEHPQEASQLVVKWRTGTLPNNSLMARDDVSPQMVARVAELLFSLQATAAGRKMLERMPLSRFEPASDDTYAPVIAYMRRFDAELGSVAGSRP